MSESPPVREPSGSSTTSDKDSSVECPTCDCLFDTVRGMKIHHKQVHGESISGVQAECDVCGDRFRRQRREVERYERHFCGRECRSVWQSDHQTGENNPSWNGGKVTKECDWCGEGITRNESEFYTDHVFCGYDCIYEWRSENHVGENSPTWKGGYDGYYGSNWTRQRRKALERDGNTCQVCGTSGEGMHVHHIHPIRDFDELDRANTLLNLITLCEPCHSEWEGLYLRPDPRG